MNKFFSLYTYTPWDNLHTNQLTEVRLLSLKSIFKKFPVIQPGFFDDLLSNLPQNKHYSRIESIKRVVGPNNEDYEIEYFSFIWGMDLEKRIYQFLFQKENNQKEESHAILAALAPPEIAKLFTDYKDEAISRTLSLLNKPKKMKFLMILTPQGKSIAEERELIQIGNSKLEKLKFINTLKNMPNIKGEWFPSFNPRCPICKGIMVELKDYKVGFNKLICPQCGYEKRK